MQLSDSIVYHSFTASSVVASKPSMKLPWNGLKEPWKVFFRLRPILMQYSFLKEKYRETFLAKDLHWVLS
jgi:hypothetical protein